MAPLVQRSWTIRKPPILCQTTLRLSRKQLGADAVDAVRNHAEALLKDLGLWEAQARATAFAPDV